MPPVVKAKTALIIGATSGLGRAIAKDLLISRRADRVIITGRRKERLQQFQDEHGVRKVSFYQHDLSQLDSIPSFVEKAFKEHNDIDLVLLVSGIQRGADFTKPQDVDLKTLELEMLTNYTSYVHFTVAALPFLQEKSKSQDVWLGYFGSVLGLVPMSRCINYCASKAAIHQFTLGLRKQLTEAFPQLHIMEILPPSVESELHDSHNQPDLSWETNGSPAQAQSLEDFTRDVMEGFDRGDLDITPGQTKKVFDTLERGARFSLLDTFP